MIRRLARPMLASVFVIDGIETLRNPQSRVASAAPLVDKATPLVEKGEQALNERVSTTVPPVPKDTETLVKALAGVKVGAGVLFALGKMPRLSAAALVASHVPTTLTRNAFWAESDPAAKSRKTTGLATDVALLGALLLASADTAGKPGLAWRAGRAKNSVAAALPGAQSGASSAAEHVTDAAHTVADQARSLAETVREKAPEVAETVREKAPEVAETVRDRAGVVAGVVASRAPEVAAAVQERAESLREQAGPAVAAAQEKAAAAREQAGPAAESARARAVAAREQADSVAGPLAAAARDRAAAARARAAMGATTVRDKAADSAPSRFKSNLDKARIDAARTIAP